MNQCKRGASRIHYLITLALFLAILIGFHYYKAEYGVTGNVTCISSSTAGKIAFVRQEKKNGRTNTNIFMVKSDGTELSQLTDDKSAKRSPAWSPDGRQLCYSGEPEQAEAEGRAFQIFIVGADRPRQITRGSQSKDAPQWR